MTRDEFLALPPTVAFGLLLDQLPKLVEALSKVPKVKLPFPPKYDHRVSRKAGMFCFASEMLTADLQFWHARAVESAASGSQYAEKDRKKAEELARWIAWRVVFPDAQWRGKRGDDVVTAAPPSRDAELHEWKRGSRNDAPVDPQGSAGGGYNDADYGGGDDGIPF